MSDGSFYLNANIVFRKEDSLLMDLDTGRVVELNESARTLMVELLNKGYGEVLDVLKKQYPEKDADEIAVDLKDFVSRLQKLGFLVKEDVSEVTGCHNSRDNVIEDI